MWAAPKEAPTPSEPRRGDVCNALRVRCQYGQRTHVPAFQSLLPASPSRTHPCVAQIPLPFARVILAFQPPRMSSLGSASLHTLLACPACFGVVRSRWSKAPGRAGTAARPAYSKY
ncbi:hypothetical protein BOTBODRAFT_58619 [Botryobasidium botryosum FD-172 SS1]|uniref:Uncharacterized protein n=1 Tax=Botryobasidium botryosum (strain FD-172 SS1) TaxID=930990 RepID=A0A067M1B6_BOTB1|nr:hypothetical protein BOTBODRAFT_58619 [Botryobasidium botryosum FD-172 SS1]